MFKITLKYSSYIGFCSATKYKTTEDVTNIFYLFLYPKDTFYNVPKQDIGSI